MDYNGKRLTMKNIAELVGVDKAIVSKVINQVEGVQVSEAKRNKIKEIVQHHNYTPLSSAQSLATRKTRQIAFLLSSCTEMSLANETFGMMLCGVEEVCRKQRYQCQIAVCDLININNFMMPENLHRRSIDGCILTGAISEEVIGRIAEVQLPLVILGGEPLRRLIPTISRDSSIDYSMYLDYCASRGHFRIWIAKDSENVRCKFGVLAKRRSEFELTILAQTGGEFEYARHWSEKFIALPKAKRPTLVLGSDQFCCGMATLLAQHGICCPEDISFVSESDTEMARWYNPPLTTFSPDFREVGTTGARVLIEMLTHDLDIKAAVTLANQYPMQSVLVERSSVNNCAH